MELICQPLLLWWLNKRHSGKNKQQLPRADSHQTHTHTLVPVLIFCHVHWLEMPLRCCSLELCDGRQHPWWQTHLGGKIRRPGDLRSPALAAAPRYSANQADQRQQCHLHSSHSRKPVCPFHSSAHVPRCSDKATCWCVGSQLRVSRCEVFFHSFITAVGGQLPRSIGSRSGQLYFCDVVEIEKRRENRIVGIHPQKSVWEATADWLPRPQPFQITSSAQMMNAGPCRIRNRKMNDQFHFQQSHL